MTLLVATEIDLARGRTLLVASDSILSAGYRWPRGPKLFTLGATCAMAFEGDTELAYPLLTNARNFIAFSDNLSSPDAEPGAIFERVRIDISEAYTQLVADKYFVPNGATCSLLLAGWSWRLGGPAVATLHQPATGSDPKTEWTLEDVVVSKEWKQYKTFFAGNGDLNPVSTAWTCVKASSDHPRIGYDAFLARVQDTQETAVGGAPQVMLLGPRVREVIGTKQTAPKQPTQRFLLGHHVASGASGLSFFDEALRELS